MILTIASAMFVLASGPAVKTETYHVLNRRPTQILKILQGAPSNGLEPRSILPDGLKVEALDKESTLTFSGPQSDIDAAIGCVKLFDVKPITVHLRIQLLSKVDHYEVTSETALPNLSSWTFRDPLTKVDVDVTPRVNDDGTITCFMSHSDGKSASQMVNRFKPNEIGLLSYGKSATWKAVPSDLLVGELEKFEKRIGDPEVPILVISVRRD